MLLPKWLYDMIALLSLLVLWVPCHSDPPSEAPAPTRVHDGFVNVLGGTWHLPRNRKAIVLIFFGHDCPISNGFAPEINRLHREFSPLGIEFCIVYADADLGVAAAQAHAKKYGFACPCILDPGLTLARKVGATIKPEAAILSPQGELLYRGRIDDRYFDLGQRRAEPTRRELREALCAILAGKLVPVPRTQAIGCDIDFPESK